MKYTQGKYPIMQKKAIANNTYSFVISCPEVAEAAQPRTVCSYKSKWIYPPKTCIYLRYRQGKRSAQDRF